MTDPRPDRYHNREEDSPEALRRAIDDLSKAVSDLDQRFDQVTSRLDSDLDGARTITRRLATEVGLMGEALVRRLDNEHTRSSSMKQRRISMWPLALAFALGLILAITGFLFLSR